MSCSTFQLCRTLQDALPKLVFLIQCSIFGGWKLVVHFGVLSVSLFSNRYLPTDDDDDFSISDVVTVVVSVLGLYKSQEGRAKKKRFFNLFVYKIIIIGPPLLS